MTLGALRAVRELRIQCPEQVSVLGFDDMVMGQDGFSLATMFSPQLTTVAQPSYEIGKEAVKLLIHKIENPEDSQPHGKSGIVRLPVELHVRESTGPPPQSRTPSRWLSDGKRGRKAPLPETNP
jgi:DNA-binding LacI/PurR family transcriptional regulator